MKLHELMQHKITVISGHFGSGKTNVAVNLALDAARAGEQVCIADLDIVNPYFRTADNAEFLRTNMKDSLFSVCLKLIISYGYRNGS